MSRVVMAGVVGLLAFSGARASAQEAPEAAVAEARYSGGEIDFEPRVGASAWTLTITGPGGFVLERRNQGSPPSISVFDDAGQPLADGSYSYQLQAEVVLSPSAFARSRHETPEGRDFALRPGVRPRELPAASGHFRIAGGTIVTPEGNEPQTRATGSRTSALAAAPTPEGALAEPNLLASDDLYVHNSACVGSDCVVPEAFGADTIRLKENNLRIRAVDTSVGSFPTNDWQITFNAAANGGQNKFSIDDIDSGRTPFTIEAGAPSHSLYVEDGGRVGFGTNTPAVDLHVVDGNTPTLRLEQDGSSGFTPQTWDVAGNEANFFIRDVTGGSTLPLRILPGAPSSAIFVKGDGRVAVNDSSPDATLHVQGKSSTVGTGNAVLKLVNTAGAVAFQLDASDNGVFWNVAAPAGDSLFRISRSGTAGTEFELNSGGDLTLRGDLTITGGCTGCDGLFQPGYPLESLEEHAAFMWQNSFLPDVGPTPDGKTKIKVFEKTAGILKELEKAHIYIAQLNDAVKEKDAEVADLRERLARLEALFAKE